VLLLGVVGAAGPVIELPQTEGKAKRSGNPLHSFCVAPWARLRKDESAEEVSHGSQILPLRKPLSNSLDENR